MGLKKKMADFLPITMGRKSAIFFFFFFFWGGGYPFAVNTLGDMSEKKELTPRGANCFLNS